MTSPPEAREMMDLFSMIGGPEIEGLVLSTKTAVLPRGTEVLVATARAKPNVDDGPVRLSICDNVGLEASDSAEY